MFSGTVVVQRTERQARASNTLSCARRCAAARGRHPPPPAAPRHRPPRRPRRHPFAATPSATANRFGFKTFLSRGTRAALGPLAARRRRHHHHRRSTHLCHVRRRPLHPHPPRAPRRPPAAPSTSPPSAPPSPRTSAGSTASSPPTSRRGTARRSTPRPSPRPTARAATRSSRRTRPVSPVDPGSFYARWWVTVQGREAGVLAVARFTSGDGLLPVFALYVDPPHRRGGVAADAIALAELGARSAGLAGVRMEVPWGWRRGLRYLLARGFWVRRWARTSPCSAGPSRRGTPSRSTATRPPSPSAWARRPSHPHPRHPRRRPPHLGADRRVPRAPRRPGPLRRGHRRRGHPLPRPRAGGLAPRPLGGGVAAERRGDPRRHLGVAPAADRGLGGHAGGPRGGPREGRGCRAHRGALPCHPPRAMTDVHDPASHTKDRVRAPVPDAVDVAVVGAGPRGPVRRRLPRAPGPARRGLRRALRRRRLRDDVLPGLRRPALRVRHRAPLRRRLRARRAHPDPPPRGRRRPGVLRPPRPGRLRHRGAPGPHLPHPQGARGVPRAPRRGLPEGARGHRPLRAPPRRGRPHGPRDGALEAVVPPPPRRRPPPRPPRRPLPERHHRRVPRLVHAGPRFARGDPRAERRLRRAPEPRERDAPLRPRQPLLPGRLLPQGGRAGDRRRPRRRHRGRGVDRPPAPPRGADRRRGRPRRRRPGPRATAARRRPSGRSSSSPTPTCAAPSTSCSTRPTSPRRGATGSSASRWAARSS